MSATIAASDTAKPTGKQIYFACRLALQALGVEWPETRAAASELIGQLQTLETPQNAATEPDDCPF